MAAHPAHAPAGAVLRWPRHLRHHTRQLVSRNRHFTTTPSLVRQDVKAGMLLVGYDGAPVSVAKSCPVPRVSEMIELTSRASNHLWLA